MVDKEPYVTIVELTNVDEAGKKTTRSVNVYADSAEKALLNHLQVEKLYKSQNNVDIRVVGTYKRAHLVVVDKEEQEK